MGAGVIINHGPRNSIDFTLPYRETSLACWEAPK